MISVGEYHQGFERYRQCLVAAGFELIPKEPKGEILTCAIPDSSIQAADDDRCYATEFKNIDATWQRARAANPPSTKAPQQSCSIEDSAPSRLPTDQKVGGLVAQVGGTRMRTICVH